MDSFLSLFWDDVRSIGGPCGLRLAACLPARPEVQAKRCCG